MHYFHWIQKYRQKVLSSADRQAYEHEQAENSRLRSEADAVDLMESLLTATASGLSEGEIVGDQPSGKKPVWKASVLGAGLVVFLLVGGWVLQQRQQPAAPVPAKEWGPRFFEPVDGYEEGEGPVALRTVPTPDRKSVSAESVSRKVESPKTPQAPVDIEVPSLEESSQPIAEVNGKQPGEEIVLGNTEVDKGAALAISAKKTITLKPGFHAKAGATFRATVEDK